MRVGECETDRNGRIIRLERECFGQGWIFKDWEAFWNREDAPCYVPELHDTAYTKKDIVILCGGQEEIAEKLFYEADWQSPSALLDEWTDMGVSAVCGKCGGLFLTSDTGKCPHCGTEYPEE